MAKEQIDETSKEKAKAYLRAAPTDLAHQEHDTGRHYERGERDDMKYHARKGKNRIEGIRRAVGKVSEETEQEEGGDQEIQEPNVSDLVVHALDQKPLDFQQSFADLMQQRIADSVYEKKLDIAGTFAGYEPGPEDENEAEESDEDDEFQPEDEDLTPSEPDEA